MCRVRWATAWCYAICYGVWPDCRSNHELPDGCGTADEVETAIVDLRRRWKRIGPLKIHQLLDERYRGRRKLPATSTIALVLKRHGMIKKRRRVRRIREAHPIFEAKGPNEIWSVDFKGKFRLGDGRYCYPLTVMDAYSRYVLAVVGMLQPTYEGTRAVFQALFKRYGLPNVCDRWHFPTMIKELSPKRSPCISIAARPQTAPRWAIGGVAATFVALFGVDLLDDFCG